MTIEQMEELCREINKRAQGRRIGELQKLRTLRKGLSKVHRLFNRQSIHEDWAHHVGGGPELQFNIGFETVRGEKMFRHGVALSMQPHKSMPEDAISRIFSQRIQRFNRFLDNYAEAFNDLSMWHYDDGKRNREYAPGSIPKELTKPRVFVMLGQLCSPDNIDMETILDNFDRFMPLYEFVEDMGKTAASNSQKTGGFKWRSGKSARVSRAMVELKARKIQAVLRHNELQDALHDHLCDMHGGENVCSELDCGLGKPVDVAVRKGGDYVYYEIKTGFSAQSCLREAFGQLMEYSFWPGAQEARELVVVGEPPLDDAALDYLERIRKRFSLPLTYRRFNLSRMSLLPR